MNLNDISFPFHFCDGRFRVEGIFADGGGMGILFEAFDERCADNRVLIKTTRYDSGVRVRNLRYTDAEAVSYIQESRRILEWERKVLVRFRNDGMNNIPSATHWFQDRSLTLAPAYEGRMGRYSIPDEILESEPYLVMECIPGRLLESRMKESTFRETLEERLLVMARELLTMLIRMHREVELPGGARGYFLYQDLKPENIIVSADDYFTLIDFGGVTLRLGGKTTEPTAGCITTGYAAPEADGNEAYIDMRFDIYTLGATLWHAVTGEDPREMPAEFPVLDPARVRSAGMSEAFTRIVGTALMRDPEKRYPNAATMRKDVMQALRHIRA